MGEWQSPVLGVVLCVAWCVLSWIGLYVGAAVQPIHIYEPCILESATCSNDGVPSARYILVLDTRRYV